MPTPVEYRQGVYVATLDGKVVMEQGADQTFNPASTVKLATALQALRTYGPDYRFTTAVWTTGTLDAATGTLTGDLIVSGRDPSLHDEHAVALAREMNRLGIRTVTGDLVVSPGFTMDFSPSALRSGERFYDTLDATRRPAAATSSWYEECQAKKDQACFTSVPGVAVMGAVYVAPVPAGAKVLLTQRSSPLVDVLKVLLCYSNNFMAERLGESMGGAPGLQSFLVREIGLPAAEVRLASTSGLGVNRLSPRSMMRVYVALREELAKHKLEPSDILPVAGVDPGTLKRRYAESASRGSVVAKTGTLGRTDGGVSALVGEMRVRNGDVLLFVIFNRRGSVYRFRQDQDALVASLQSARGGAAPFPYTPHTLAMRLADTEFNARNKNEYEGTSNDER
jgi:D-alanyl-D-alanine carboxypeptidase/D-alanyl-D-alanine-endopeptidase (penicillin-binding protein 4)